MLSTIWKSFLFQTPAQYRQSRTGINSPISKIFIRNPFFPLHTFFLATQDLITVIKGLAHVSDPFDRDLDHGNHPEFWNDVKPSGGGNTPVSP